MDCMLALVERHTAILELLRSRSPEWWSQPILHLPNLDLSLSLDRERFHFDEDNSIRIVNRKQLVNEYIEFVKARSKIYVHGVRGIGNSFLLYQMAARLMADASLRVVYIGKPNRNVAAECLRILRIIFTADRGLFATNQTVIYERVINLMPAEGAPVSLSDAVHFLNEIMGMYDCERIGLAFIIDQMNALEFDEFKSQTLFCSGLNLYGLLVLSGTTNNDRCRLNVSSDVLMRPPIKLTNDEFAAFRQLQANKSAIKTDQERDLVMSITGGLPLELQRFFNARVGGVDTVSNRLLSYVELFREDHHVATMREYLQKCKSDPWMLKYLNESMNCFFFRRHIRNCNNIYDKRFISPEERGDRTHLEAINVVAKLLLSEIYRPESIDKLKSDFMDHNYLLHSNEQTQRESYTHFIVESFLLRRQLTVEIKDWNFSIKYQLESSDFEVARFFAADQALICVDGPRSFAKDVLFLPLDSSRSSFDFCFFRPSTPSALFCFSVLSPRESPIARLQESLQIESSSSIDRHKSVALWSEYLPAGTVVSEAWFVNRASFDPAQITPDDDQKLDSLNIAFFQDMDIFDGINLDFRRETGLCAA